MNQGRNQWPRLQKSLKRGRPFGSDAWIEHTAKNLTLETTLRPIGRPRNNLMPFENVPFFQ
jgi:putative transposase